MLGDAIAYGISLYVVGMGVVAKARSAMFKGGIILLSSASVLGAAIYRAIFQELPAFEVMGLIGALALAANRESARVRVIVQLTLRWPCRKPMIEAADFLMRKMS
jgi:Co/Zn/Cd efflux system component